ncbi:MAG: efflux RND transporter periplasmic adaptor subunit [Gemmataceae bacterium]
MKPFYVFDDLFCRLLRSWPALLVLAALGGCHKAEPTGQPIAVEPEVKLVNPERRDLHREVGQPGYVYAYEQTSLFAKVAGYIEEWMVDIGDLVKKGQLLTHIYVPELHARHREKKADVYLDNVHVRVAEQMVEVARARLDVARADVMQAREDVKKYQASVDRWSSEVVRLNSVSDVVTKQILEESKKRLAADIAARDAASAVVTAAQAHEQARKVDLEKAKVDVEAARAKVVVDEAAVDYLAALVSYTLIHAPYDGVIIVRNANTGDYVEPRYGDESAPLGGIMTANRERGTPIYVLARTDIVRIYVDVPEIESNYIDRGTKARVRIQSLNDAEIEGSVTRTSWALNVQSRTLRAEIDLPNKGARMRPGMYAYGMIEIERRNVLTVPMSSVVEIGNEHVVYLHEDGKAMRTPVQIGISDGKFVEVFLKKIKNTWVEFDGHEEVIVRSNLASISDGEKVRIAKSTSQEQSRTH